MRAGWAVQQQQQAMAVDAGYLQHQGRQLTTVLLHTSCWKTLFKGVGVHLKALGSGGGVQLEAGGVCVCPQVQGAALCVFVPARVSASPGMLFSTVPLPCPPAPGLCTLKLSLSRGQQGVQANSRQEHTASCCCSWWVSVCAWQLSASISWASNNCCNLSNSAALSCHSFPAKHGG